MGPLSFGTHNAEFRPDKTKRIYKLLKARIFFLFILLAGLLSTVSPEIAYSGANTDEQVELDQSNLKHPVSGQPIQIKIRVVPVPSRQKPVHLHIFVDNRLVLMLTLTRPLTMASLPPLSTGRHSVVFIEANPLTHRPMEGNSRMTGMKDMGMGMTGSGKDMGMMDDNLSSIPARFRLKTLTLVVEPR